MQSLFLVFLSVFSFSVFSLCVKLQESSTNTSLLMCLPRPRCFHHLPPVAAEQTVCLFISRPCLLQAELHPELRMRSRAGVNQSVWDLLLPAHPRHWPQLQELVCLILQTQTYVWRLHHFSSEECELADKQDQELPGRQAGRQLKTHWKNNPKTTAWRLYNRLEPPTVSDSMFKFSQRFTEK